ncbi:MAG: Transposase IS200 like protein [Syntrophorhabdaceae bacterium PtaU1.Bin034]|nr:MAG: Transposase IS200 like protein [Syntrophorhabdaceae bacterium PtaU1.Bin034]
MIFRDDQDKESFVSRMGKVFVDTGTPCYAWCLLGNHAHLLLKTGKTALHTVMARLLTGHAVSFNKRHKRHGQLFQNRYKSILCQEENYLTELVCYIHLNPLRAGIVKELGDLVAYPYSGHAALMGRDVHSWQEVDYILLHFGRTLRSGRDGYLSFMNSRVDKGKRADLTGGGLIRSYGSWREVKAFSQTGRLKGDERILGDSDFVQKILSAANERLSSKAAHAGMTLDALAMRIDEIYHIGLDALVRKNRRSHLVEARSLFCFWAVREAGFSAAVVAGFVGITPQGVGYAVERGEKVAREKGYEL